jgi:acetyl-CoA C-acetyltransferase
MGLEPANAIADLLTSHHLTLDDINYWEINEAFAAQVQACVITLNDENYCNKALGLTNVMGIIPSNRLNIDGGAISLGHPVGASGARIVLHLAKILRRKQALKGIASLCIGAGQGGAILVEAIK